MNTFAQLKRDLKVGDTLICLYHYIDRKNEKRIIERVNTADVKFKTGVYLRFPISSKLVEYEKDVFSFFAHGKEYLDKKIYDEWRKGSSKLKGKTLAEQHNYYRQNPLKEKEMERISDIIYKYSNLNCKDGELPYKYNKNIKGIKEFTFRLLKTSLLKNL